MRATACLTLVVIAISCSKGEGDESRDSAAAEAADPSAAPGAGLRSARLAADSVGITSQSGDILLSVAHDSVSMGFSQTALDKIRRETDTAGAGTGIGGMIERSVKSSVQSMLSTRIMVPVDDIESVRYEDGAIRFEYLSRPRGMTLEDIKVNDRQALESFSDADARLFVSAVQARLRLR